MSFQDVDDVAGAIGEAGRVLEPGGRFCFAIVHPINSAGEFAEPSARAPFVIEGSYLEPHRTEYRIDRGGIPMTFHSMHRPLADYIQPMSPAGLLLETLLEPRM